ncbi:MAG: DUF308 domain-containing protein [Bacilli bacterium]|jgi:uncharacterized membrane protein HdeD (DUF308 family)
MNDQISKVNEPQVKALSLINFSLSITLIILGLIMFLFPFMGAIPTLGLFASGLFIYAVFFIIKYMIKKDNWFLIKGCASIILCCLTLISIFLDSALFASGGTLYPFLKYSSTILFWLLFAVGFWTLFYGIFQLVMVSNIRKSMNFKKTKITFGVITIGLGAMMITLPTYGNYFTVMYALAAYIILIGVISLLSFLQQRSKNSK